MFAIQVQLYRLLMLVLKGLVRLIPQNLPALYVGQGSAAQLARHVGLMGHQRVLIVTDKDLHRLGLLEPVLAVFETQGITVSIFDEVLPDPSLALIERGVAQARRVDVQAILAVGGGSSIDAAKMIAVGLGHRGALRKLTGLLKVRSSALPLYVVPTTAGTGSEVTMAAVVTDTATGQKCPVIDPKLMPLAAALDPNLMRGLPARITAATGLDALTHAIEAYLSGHATPATDAYAQAAVRLIFSYLQQACEDGQNLAAREAMALASCYAGMAFTRANLGYVHGIAHQLGAKYHLSHGEANALVLPRVLDYYGDAVSGRLAQLARVIGIEGTEDGQLSKAFIQQVRQLIVSLGLPQQLTSLQPVDVPELARAALKEAHFLYPVPRYMDRLTCERLIQQLAV